jgi:hypothetical protein
MAARLRVPDGAKVAGLIATPTAEPLHDRPIVNGARGAVVDNRATLRPRWRHLDVALTHVEGHVAAIMREPDGPKQVVLVVSREPCPGELGCRKLLPGMLPADAHLSVYVADRDGVRYFDTYLGTGAGAAS